MTQDQLAVIDEYKLDGVDHDESSGARISFPFILTGDPLSFVIFKTPFLSLFTCAEGPSFPIISFHYALPTFRCA